MAADVSMSRVVEYLKNTKKKDDDKPQPVPVLMLHHHDHPSKESTPPPMTRDLLGLEFQSSQELVDLDSHVPSGWEKRLDLKSGKVYIQRCSSQALPATSSLKHHQPINSAPPHFQDLNFPPSPTKLAFNGSDDAFLDLKLLTSSSPSTSCNYQSVCTLDKVKSALERADREPSKKRSPFWKSPPSSPLYSLASSSIKETREEDSNQEMSAIATCCPSCLLYVLISKTNPKCPRCNYVVPLPSSKKPRIDLNISI
ncbi:uncharacterized protein LOC115738637 [Rhodamnia argentea]|uniref:Uncharacterized protein LOC115738637 n=1 Tax=Rhodamnia argentea TaxID=178133 RepID=A0A8B8NZR1_9MYRT|nr:uncharacterized protein LOC115738637 [Rhodamnia argentea]